MAPGWVPFKIVSDRPALHTRWLLLLKIEISSIVHCCFSISQNELKFKLQLHGKEYFSICSGFLAHLAFRPGELLSSLFVRRLSSVVRRPSVNISHFNLLLRNHWTNCNQTLVEWSLDGPLSKLCPVIPTSNQDGRQAKNRKKGG